MKIASWIPFLLLLLFPSYPLGALDISPAELPWRASELTDPRRELDGLAAKAEETKDAELAVAVALAAIATGENPDRVIPRCRFAAPLQASHLRQIYDFLQTEEDLRTADDIRKELGTVPDLSLAWQRFIRAREEGGEDETIFADGLRNAAELDTKEVIFQELRLLHDPSAATAEAELYFRNHKDYPPRVRAILEELIEAERLTAAVALVAELPLDETESVQICDAVKLQILLLPSFSMKTRHLESIKKRYENSRNAIEVTPWFSKRYQYELVKDHYKENKAPSWPECETVMFYSSDAHVDSISPSPAGITQLLTSRTMFRWSSIFPSEVVEQTWAKILVSAADQLETGNCIPWHCEFPVKLDRHAWDLNKLKQNHIPLPDIAAAYLKLGDLEGARRMALVQLGSGNLAPLCFHERYARRDFDLLLPGLLALGMPDSPAVPELARRYRLGLERLLANDGFSARRHFRRALRKDRELATLRHLLLEGNPGTLNTEH